MVLLSLSASRSSQSPRKAQHHVSRRTKVTRTSPSPIPGYPPILSSIRTCRRREMMPDCHHRRCQAPASLATGTGSCGRTRRRARLSCLAPTSGAFHLSIELSIGTVQRLARIPDCCLRSKGFCHNKLHEGASGAWPNARAVRYVFDHFLSSLVE